MNEHLNPPVWNPNRLEYEIAYKNIIINIRELPGNENSDFIIKFDRSINFENAIKIDRGIYGVQDLGIDTYGCKFST